jgi:tRNA pseudouridine55 synthase
VSRRGRSTPGVDGLLLLDKPAGPTSHDCVSAVRRLFGQRRVGHAGTLDPAARGLLLVGLGRATRLLEYLAGCDKGYHGQIVLGRETDSYDDQGAVTAESDASPLTQPMVAEALARFQGEIQQRPPMVSAKKVGGQPLHRLARRGETVEIEPVTVRLDQVDLTAFEPGPAALAEVVVACGAGTYIRSLAHDLGQALGVGGHLRGLVRDRVGGFDLSEAVSLADLEAMDPAQRLGCLRPLRECVRDLPTAVVPAELRAALGMGQALAIEGLTGVVALLDEAGELLAVGVGDGAVVRPRKVVSGD